MLKKILPLLLILMVLISFSGAHAQENPGFSAVEVNLWPEFDRPSMLVIYHITLSPETTLPAEMNIRIPLVAGVPNAVAARQPNGSLINIPYTQEEDGNWSQIIFQATNPELQIEYYDPSLSIDGTSRHFAYLWPGDYAVDSFVIQVQEPLGAIDMQISPSLGSGAPAGDGMVYYTSQVGPLTEGQSFVITVDYEKDSDELSAGSVPVQPSGPLEDTTPGSVTLSSALPFILGGLGVLLIAGGAWWYWQSGRERPQPNKKRARSRRKPVSQSQEAAGEHIYCHQCGKRAMSGDLFCRACGTELRR
jgi:hypothetical protein